MTTDFIPKPRKGGTVVILGAGASFGSDVASPPPIVKDFIRKGRQLKLRSDYSRLWELIDKLGFSIVDLETGKPNIEEVFSILQVMSTGLWYTSNDDLVRDLGSSFWKIPPVYILESFIVEIIARASENALKHTCPHHDQIIQSLSKGDTVISFNYDLIADASVKKMRPWSELSGYAFLNLGSISEKPERESLLEVPADIALLKLHGSLNWKAEMVFELPSTVPIGSENMPPALLSPPNLQETLSRAPKKGRLKLVAKFMEDMGDSLRGSRGGVSEADVYDELARVVPENQLWKLGGVQVPSSRPYIVPPTISKLGDIAIPQELASVWATARVAITSAAKVICIGYSFAPGDIEFSSLFRWSMRRNEGEVVVEIVDPNASVVDRVKSLAPNTRITQVAESLREYARSVAP